MGLTECPRHDDLEEIEDLEGVGEPGSDAERMKGGAVGLRYVRWTERDRLAGEGRSVAMCSGAISWSVVFCGRRK